jgi:choline dehydrogenase
VGSGSAGSVIANRLSEVPHWNILVLEVGNEENFLAEVPLATSFLHFTDYTNRYLMAYQPGIAQACDNHRMPWPRGRALGGTTVINYMVYSRGNRYDYDRWASQGNPSWSYSDVLPYFIKSENSGLKVSDPTFHGIDGYLSVEDAYQTPISEAFIQGLQQLGLPYIDYNSNSSLGVSMLQATTQRGRRHSAAKAFLKPVRHRPNLHILTGALVTKVLINRKTKEAYGVEYERFGKTYKVGVTKEVVVCAGPISSPQLLMLSGIGPREHLEDFGIAVVQDLQVGQNLQDHLAFLGLSFVTNQDVTMRFSDLYKPKNIRDFLVSGTGRWTSIGGAQAIAFVKTVESQQVEDIPDIELFFLGGSLATDYGVYLRTGMHIRDDVYKSVFAPMEKKPSFMIIPSLLTPKSKGFLKLSSTNPHDQPLLYGNFLTDKRDKDVDTLLAAVRVVQSLARTEAFWKFNASFNTNVVPGCKQHSYDSDQYWKCALRALSLTFHHQVGTVKMGPKEDWGAVVDNKLRVYGVGRLRVADSSVIPFAIGAHTNAPAVMIGEKAADAIKDTWKEYL